MAPDKNRKKQAGGRFQPGQSGNPKGRPHGSRNYATELAMRMLRAETESLVSTCLELAKNGDMSALRLALERICPAPRGRTITVDLAPVTDAAGVSRGLAQLTRAVGAGELAPAEANEVAALLDAQRKAIETNEFEARLRAIEKAISERGK